MSRRRIRVTEKACKRCGRKVYGVNRPIVSSQATYDRFAGICEDCFTDDDREQLLDETTENIIGRMSS